MKPKYNIKTGDVVVCIINSRSSLTVGNKYKVLSNSQNFIYIANDNGYELYYNISRFIPVGVYREHFINSIIKN